MIYRIEAHGIFFVYHVNPVNPVALLQFAERIGLIWFCRFTI